MCGAWLGLSGYNYCSLQHVSFQQDALLGFVAFSFYTKLLGDPSISLHFSVSTHSAKKKTGASPIGKGKFLRVHFDSKCQWLKCPNFAKQPKKNVLSDFWKFNHSLHCDIKVTELRLVRHRMWLLRFQQGRIETSLPTVSFLGLCCTGRDHVDWFVSLLGTQTWLPCLFPAAERSCHLGGKRLGHRQQAGLEAGRDLLLSHHLPYTSTHQAHHMAPVSSGDDLLLSFMA